MPQTLFLHIPPVNPFTLVTNVTAFQICMCDVTKILNVEFIIMLENTYLNICLTYFYDNIISFCYIIFFNPSLFKIIVEIIKKQKEESSTLLYVLKCGFPFRVL
jgi:hypothetical protein